MTIDTEFSIFLAACEYLLVDNCPREFVFRIDQIFLAKWPENVQNQSQPEDARSIPHP